MYYADGLLVSTEDDLVPETLLGSGPMQHQSNHSSTIQANPMSIHPNLVPNHSNADPHNLGVVNSSAIQCQFSTNPFPIDFQSAAHSFPIQCQSMTNPSIDLQSFARPAFARRLLRHSSNTAKSQKTIGTHRHRSRQSQHKTIQYLSAPCR